MLNQTYSKTNFLVGHLDFEFNINRVLDNSFKKDDIYLLENGILNLSDSIIYESKNIFSIYLEECYDLYKGISILLKDVHKEYTIDIEKQKYMIYGKVSEYNKETNKNWYDFPGINIPQLHGMYFPDSCPAKLTFKNNNNIKEYTFDKNMFFINKPTDLIRVDVENKCNVVEFYVFPMYTLKHNEPGVWVPIL